MMKERGFTLIEIIVVIAVMLIIAGAVTFAVITTSMGPNILDAAANRLVFDLRYAQQLAISRHTSCGISFDPSGNSYFVYIGSTSTKAPDPYTRKSHILDYDTANEFKGVSLVSTNFGDNVYFNYMGAPYGSTGSALSSQGIVTLQEGSNAMTVTIEPNTGRVE